MSIGKEKIILMGNRVKSIAQSTISGTTKLAFEITYAGAFQ